MQQLPGLSVGRRWPGNTPKSEKDRFSSGSKFYIVCPQNKAAECESIWRLLFCRAVQDSKGVARRASRRDSEPGSRKFSSVGEEIIRDRILYGPQDEKA